MADSDLDLLRDLSAHIFMLQEERKLAPLGALARYIAWTARESSEQGGDQAQQNALLAHADALKKLEWCIYEMITGKEGIDTQKLGAHRARQRFTAVPEYTKDLSPDTRNVGEVLMEGSSIVRAAFDTLNADLIYRNELAWHPEDYDDLQQTMDKIALWSGQIHNKLPPPRHLS